MDAPQLLEVITAGDVSLARPNRTVMDVPAAQAVCEELSRAAVETGRHEWHLDLSDAEFLPAGGLGRLLALDAQLRAAGGGLHLWEVDGSFDLARLQTSGSKDPGPFLTMKE
jgi:anti-anti-sigma regulatory factor